MESPQFLSRVIILVHRMTIKYYASTATYFIIIVIFDVVIVIITENCATPDTVILLYNDCRLEHRSVVYGANRCSVCCVKVGNFAAEWKPFSIFYKSILV